MTVRILDFETSREARQYVVALGRSSAFTRGGRPPIGPSGRCDSGAWGDSEVKQGRGCPPDPCTDRTSPDPECPYRTLAASEVLAFESGGFAVVITEVQEQARGEVIRVDGVNITIDDSASRDATARELAEQTRG